MEEIANNQPSLFERKSILILVGSVLVVILAVVFQSKFEEFTSLGLFGIFLLSFFGSATLFLPAPAIAAVVAGGVLYSPVLVALFSAVGSTLGELVGYFIGQSSKKVVSTKKQTRIYTLFYNIFHTHGGVAVFFFALIPNPFFDFFGIMAGMFGLSVWRFFLIVFVARFLRDTVLAYFGSRIPTH